MMNYLTVGKENSGDIDLYYFAIDGKGVVVSVDGPIAVGTHVRLVEETGDRGSRLSVTAEGN